MSGWSKPTVVRGGSCYDLSATIDDSGRSHVVAICDDRIRYLTSVDRVTWKETSFVPPTHRLELEPRVAVDGTAVSVAYSLLAPREGGCGDPGLLDEGVYVVSRQSTADAWSDPVRIGSVGDRVQAFRVVDGVIHLTVTNDDGRSVFYESKSATGSTRIQIPDAASTIPDAASTSLRVGDDGRARIAYVTGHAIRYAAVDGDHLSIQTVAETAKTFFQWPSLVLDPAGRASIIWTESTEGGGCAGPGPGPQDGTYVARERPDGWSVDRISKSDGQTSLTLDPGSGAIEAVVVGGGLPGFGTKLFTETPDGWTSAAIPDGSVGYPVMRHDPATGALVLFGLSNDGVVVLAKP